MGKLSLDIPLLSPNPCNVTQHFYVRAFNNCPNASMCSVFKVQLLRQILF